MADKKKPEKQDQVPKAAEQPADDGTAILEFDEKPTSAKEPEGRSEGDTLAGSEGLKTLAALDTLHAALMVQLKPLFRKAMTNIGTRIVLKHKDSSVNEVLDGLLLPGLDDTLRQESDFTEKLQKADELAPVRKAFETLLGKSKPRVSLTGEADAESKEQFWFVLTLDLKKLAA